MDIPPYWVLIREMKDGYHHRLRLVTLARRHGLKPAARALQTTRRTGRQWRRRSQQEGPSGLVGRARAPHRQPRQPPPAIEQAVVALRQRLFTFGARRLIRDFGLPLSHRALERLGRAHGLIRKRRRQ